MLENGDTTDIRLLKSLLPGFLICVVEGLRLSSYNIEWGSPASFFLCSSWVLWLLDGGYEYRGLECIRKGMTWQAKKVVTPPVRSVELLSFFLERPVEGLKGANYPSIAGTHFVFMPWSLGIKISRKRWGYYLIPESNDIHVRNGPGWKAEDGKIDTNQINKEKNCENKIKKRMKKVGENG